MPHASNKRQRFTIPVGVVLGGMIFLVFGIGLAVWIATISISQANVRDLSRTLTTETSKRAVERLRGALSEVERANDFLSESIRSNLLNVSFDDPPRPSESNGFFRVAGTVLRSLGVASSIAVIDNDHRLFGSYTSTLDLSRVNFTGQAQLDPCSVQGNWSSRRIGSSEVELMSMSYNPRNSMYRNNTIRPYIAPTVNMTTTGWQAKPTALPDLPAIHFVYLEQVQAAASTVWVMTSIAQHYLRMLLDDANEQQEVEVFMVTFNESSSEPIVIASRQYPVASCVTCQCDTGASNPNIFPPSMYHSSIDSYIVAAFGSWENASSANWRLDGNHYNLVDLQLGSRNGAARVKLVTVLPESLFGSLEANLTTLIVIMIVSAVVQLILCILVVVLIRSSLKRLNTDINKAAQLDLIQDEDDYDDQRIGGFDILTPKHSDAYSPDGSPLASPNTQHERMAAAVAAQTSDESIFTEVARLQSGFREMLTVIRSFTFYVPQDIVRRLIRKGELASLHMSYRYVGLMFIDVENFTTMCESMRERRLVKIMEIYFGICGEVIADSGGTVDKYIGDAVMAIWGAPTTVDSVNLRASLAALMIAQQIHDPATQEVMGDINFRIRIGLHGGRALCGNLGSRKRMNFTALGDAVNLASRLESLNKEYGTRIMVSAAVARDIVAYCVVRQLGKVTVKGKSIATEVYELVGIRPSAQATMLSDDDYDEPDKDAPIPVLGVDGQASTDGDDRRSSSIYEANTSYGDGATYLTGGESTAGGTIQDAKYTVRQLVQLCRQVAEVDQETIDFCEKYSLGVQQYLRADYGASIETFGKAAENFTGSQSGDDAKRLKAMEKLVSEMEAIMSSGFGGGGLGMGNGGGSRRRSHYEHFPTPEQPPSAVPMIG